jgi:hypothetical protein
MTISSVPLEDPSRSPVVPSGPSRDLRDPDDLPLYRLVPVLDPQGHPVPGYQGVEREDTREVVSVVGHRYGLVQHRAVAEALRHLGSTLDRPPELSETPTFPRESFRLYAGGRRFEGKLVLGRKFDLGEGEAFYPGLRVLNSLDGSWAVRVEAFALRLACTNQLYAGLNESLLDLRACHVSSSRDVLAQLQAALNRILARFQGVLELYGQAMAHRIAVTEVGPSLLRAGLPARHVEPVVRALPEHFGVLLWGEVTRWEAYQRVTDYLSHEVRVNPERERLLERAAARALLFPEGTDAQREWAVP